MLKVKIDVNNPDMDSINVAADAIRRGELVVFPTETVYGLAADARNDEAVKKIFIAKGRNTNVALPVQIASADCLDSAADFVSNEAKCLAKRFWPGPLTIIFKKNPAISDYVTGGKDTVGIRIPKHNVALALLETLGFPIVATSANLSGKAPAKDADEAASDLSDLVSVVIDSGPSSIGVASTVIDMSVLPPKILRQGTISEAEIRNIIGNVENVAK